MRMSRSQTEAEGLTLLVANNKTGYFGVNLAKPGRPKPYQAQVWRGGKGVCLGMFATSKEGGAVHRAVAGGAGGGEQACSAPPLMSEEARQQAEAGGLALLKADSTTGYFGVNLNNPGYPKPYQAQVWRGGSAVPEQLRHRRGNDCASCDRRRGGGGGKRAAASEEGNPPAMPSGATLKREGVIPPMPPGAFVKEEHVRPCCPMRSSNRTRGQRVQKTCEAVDDAAGREHGGRGGGRRHGGANDLS